MKEGKLLEEKVLSWKPIGLRIKIQKYQDIVYNLNIVEELKFKKEQPEYIEHCGKCPQAKLYDTLINNYKYGGIHECNNYEVVK